MLNENQPKLFETKMNHAGVQEFIISDKQTKDLFTNDKKIKNEQAIRDLTRHLIADWASIYNWFKNARTGKMEYFLSDFVKSFINENKLQQPDVVIAHIKAFGFITNKICRDRYGYNHLPSVIQKIERRNYVVKTRPIQDAEFNRFNQHLPSPPVEYYFDNVVTPEFQEKFLRRLEG